ncbi:hypothetical protein Efla_006813 [Eimeria flavescens]
MLRKGGDAAEFVYGIGISSLEPDSREEDDEDMPLRFVGVKLELPGTIRNFDIDLHGFLFESDGAYVDCVFYKNPTLAGKSVRLLQEEQELLVDLRYVPRRCSFIVCTLAIYSGGTVAQLGNGTVRLTALVPRTGQDVGAQFPDLPAGQLPAEVSDVHEWVCLGVLPLKPGRFHGEECGMMLCLLSRHGKFWYFKPVLKAVSAFTPQGLIEPAQDFVTRHAAGAGENQQGVELGTLLKAVREGTQVELALTDTEGSMFLEFRWLLFGRIWCRSYVYVICIYSVKKRLARWAVQTHRERAARLEGRVAKDAGEQPDHGGFTASSDHQGRTLSAADGETGMPSMGLHAQWEASSDGAQKVPGYQHGTHEGREVTAAMTTKRTGRPDKGFAGKAGFGQKARGEEAKFWHHEDDEREQDKLRLAINGRRHIEQMRGGVSGKQWWDAVRASSPVRDYMTGKAQGMQRATQTRQEIDYVGTIAPRSLFTSYPSPEKYSAEETYGAGGDAEGTLGGAEGDREYITSAWKDSVERRLAALESSVDSMRADIRAVAAAATDMQRNNKLYVEELREKYTELRGDVAADIEAALAGPIEALNARLDKVEANEAADAKQLAEQQEKLWAVDRMVILAERNSHLIAQSLSELRYQLLGFEKQIVSGASMQKAAMPPTDKEKGLPVFLRSAAVTGAPRPLRESALAHSAKARTELLGGPGEGVFASEALAELNKMQYHAEAFGKCLRLLASGTAPDGLKGLNPIERKVLAFAGTPKVFDALHELERAVDAINLHGSGTTATRLY